MVESEYFTMALMNLGRDPKLREDIQSLHKKYLGNKKYRGMLEFVNKMRDICRRAHVYESKPYVTLMLSAFEPEDVVQKSFLVKGYFAVTKRNLAYQLCDEVNTILKRTPLSIERESPNKKRSAKVNTTLPQESLKTWVDNFKKNCPLSMAMIKKADEALTRFGVQDWRKTFSTNHISLREEFPIFLGRPQHFEALAINQGLKNTKDLYEIITGNEFERDALILTEDFLEPVLKKDPVCVETMLKDLDCEVVAETSEYVEIKIRIQRKG